MPVSPIPITLSLIYDNILSLVGILSNLPVCQIYVEDAEADDAIGYMIRYKLKDYHTIIVSSDHDFYQLVKPLN